MVVPDPSGTAHSTIVNAQRRISNSNHLALSASYLFLAANIRRCGANPAPFFWQVV